MSELITGRYSHLPHELGIVSRHAARLWTNAASEIGLLWELPEVEGLPADNSAFSVRVFATEDQMQSLRERYEELSLERPEISNQ